MIGPAGNNGPFRCTIAETVGRAERTLFEPRVGTYRWPAGAWAGMVLTTAWGSELTFERSVVR